MNLLLTSAGLTTDELKQKLADIAGDKRKVGFIPTARTASAGNKANHIKALNNLIAAGFDWIDIIEPTAEGVDWQTRLDAVDVVYLAGGNTFYLMHQLNKTGLGKWLIDNKDNNIYVGESAGSIVMTPSIAIASVDDGDVNEVGLKDLSGLGLVDFEVSPHTPEDVSIKANEDYAKTINNILYAYDDNSALYFGEAIENITSSKILNF